MEVKRAFFLIILAIILVGAVLFGLSDSAISIADTSIPDNEMTTRQAEASNSSASATITITMYTGDGE